jgi:hypothetical protein
VLPPRPTRDRGGGAFASGAAKSRFAVNSVLSPGGRTDGAAVRDELSQYAPELQTGLPQNPGKNFANSVLFASARQESAARAVYRGQSRRFRSPASGPLASPPALLSRRRWRTLSSWLSAPRWTPAPSRREEDAAATSQVGRGGVTLPCMRCARARARDRDRADCDPAGAAWGSRARDRLIGGDGRGCGPSRALRALASRSATLPPPGWTEPSPSPTSSSTRSTT